MRVPFEEHVHLCGLLVFSLHRRIFDKFKQFLQFILILFAIILAQKPTLNTHESRPKSLPSSGHQVLQLRIDYAARMCGNYVVNQVTGAGKASIELSSHCHLHTRT